MRTPVKTCVITMALPERFYNGQLQETIQIRASAWALRDIALDRRDDQALLATLRYPDIHAGVEGVRWVERCVSSADRGGEWIDY